MEKFCQSCGMPLKEEKDFGTNKDGTTNQDYCTYCYQKGEFLQDVTMEQMIEHCLQFVEEFNKDVNTQFNKEQAKEEMQKYFPMLKRWKQ